MAMDLDFKARLKKRILHALIYVFCITLAVTAFYPLYTMLISSTHDSYNIVTKLNLLPGPYFAQNYQRLTKNINIWRGFANSLFLASVGVVVKLYFCAMAAYAFAKFSFKLKNMLFAVVMVAMMLPGQLGIIGYYREVGMFNLLDSYIPIIISSIADCFVIFFFKQYLDGGLPNEIIEAAYVDGCRELTIFHRIVLPVMSSALVTQGVLSFIAAWNSYMTPLILLRSQDKLTLPLLVATVRDAMHAEYGAQYVGMLISVAPLIVIYCFASKIIMEKIAISSAVKG